MTNNKHVAVKCTYNDGNEGDYVGFSSTCTNEIIKLNTKNRIWCSQSECVCRQYYDSGFKGKNPIDPCMESTLFKKWWFGAGWYHTEKRKGQPKRANLIDGGIAILTTRFPEDKEEDRKIVGLFKISKVTNKKGEETKFYADKKYRIRFPLEEAKQLFLWDYYSINAKKPAWGSHLLRYLTDGQIKKLLLDISQTVQSPEHREIIGSLLHDFHDIEVSSKGLRKKDTPRLKRIAIKRKYGPGGEGENHKKLKEWVAKNPQAIGIKNVRKHEIEYVFQSGDSVDILFELHKEKDAVVEIETTIPHPGCYQAIKYRALRCAERLLDLDSKQVQAILVAWSIPLEVRSFCDKYNINYYEIKLDD